MKKKDRFTKKIFIKFFFPSLFSAVGLGVANVADALVVGRKMGETGLAAISIILPVFMLYNVLGVGFAVGGGTQFTRLLTEGKARQAVGHFNQILLVSLGTAFLLAVCGTLFLPHILYFLGAKDGSSLLYELAFSYARIVFLAAPIFFLNFILYQFLRNDDDQKLAAAGYVVSSIADFSLNCLLVLVLDWGVAGAAWSTVIAQTLGILIYLPHLFQKPYILRLAPVKIRWKEVMHSFLVGFSSSVQYVFQFVFLLAANQMFIRQAGETGVAIFDLVLNVSYVAFFFFTAAADSILPMVSTFAGERDRQAERETVRLSVVWGIVGNGVLAAGLAGAAGSICRLFGLTDPETIETGAAAIRIFCISTVAGGLNMTAIAVSQAREKAKDAFAITALRSCVLLLPSLFLLSGMGTAALFWMFAITETLTLILWTGVLWQRKRSQKKQGQEKTACSAIYSRQIETAIADVGEILSETEQFCEENGATMKQQYYVTMVVEEITMAIMEHAFRQEHGFIRLTLFVNEQGEFELHIRDSARKFNLFDMKTQKLEKGAQNEESAKTIGLYMVKEKAKEFFYRNYQGFNSLIVKI